MEERLVQGIRIVVRAFRVEVIRIDYKEAVPSIILFLYS